jgi:hypothetical protein
MDHSRSFFFLPTLTNRLDHHSLGPGIPVTPGSEVRLAARTRDSNLGRKGVWHSEVHSIWEKSTRQYDQSDRKQSSHLLKDKSWALASSPPFDVDSDDVGHSKRDDDLQFAEWTRFQADHAHIYVRVVDVAAYEKPSTLRDRCIKCRSLG